MATQSSGLGSCLTITLENRRVKATMGLKITFSTFKKKKVFALLQDLEATEW